MNLLLRFLSACILIPLVLFCLSYDIICLKFLNVLLVTIAGYEYTKMVFPQKEKLWILMPILFGFITIINYYFLEMGAFLLVFTVIILGICFVFYNYELMLWEKICSVFIVMFFVIYSLYSTFLLFDYPPYMLSMLLCVVLNDSCAYFAGNLFGKHKLCPQISDKKTIEGFIGGSIGSLLAPFLAKYCFLYLDYSFNLTTKDILFIAIPSIFLAPLGDLFESKLKRMYKVKDAGGLIPGHGGVLDRIDSLLFVAPWIWLYVFYLRNL